MRAGLTHWAITSRRPWSFGRWRWQHGAAFGEQTCANTRLVHQERKGNQGKACDEQQMGKEHGLDNHQARMVLKGQWRLGPSHDNKHEPAAVLFDICLSVHCTKKQKSNEMCCVEKPLTIHILWGIKWSDESIACTSALPISTQLPSVRGHWSWLKWTMVSVISYRIALQYTCVSVPV